MMVLISVQPKNALANYTLQFGIQVQPATIYFRYKVHSDGDKSKIALRQFCVQHHTDNKRAQFAIGNQYSHVTHPQLAKSLNNQCYFVASPSVLYPRTECHVILCLLQTSSCTLS